MRVLIGILFVTAPLIASAADTKNPMSAGDVTCHKYLQMSDTSAEKIVLESWVAGRIAAIVPATFQPNLRKISNEQLRENIIGSCKHSDPEITLFDISAILAHSYQKEHKD